MCIVSPPGGLSSNDDSTCDVVSKKENAKQTGKQTPWQKVGTRISPGLVFDICQRLVRSKRSLLKWFQQKNTPLL